MPTKTIHDISTGEVIERDFTADELAQWEADKAEAEAKAQADADKTAIKTAAEAKLAALGLTADDLQALGL